MTAERPPVLALADPPAPGSGATVDGRPARVWPANVLSRGVVVPAGTHRVEFAYRAPGLGPGVATAGTVWAAFAAAAALARLRRRRAAR